MQLSKTFWLAIAVGALAFGAPAAFSPTYAQTAVGEVSIESATQSGADVGDFANDDENADPGVNFKGTVHKGVKTFITAYLEYNTSSCAFVSSGTWKVTKKPKKGKTSTGLFAGNIQTSDHCNGTHYTQFNAIYYTASKSKGKDSFKALWSTNDSCGSKCHVPISVKLTLKP